MKVNEHHIKVEKTARYYSLEPISNNVKHLWFVVHGYAQLAKDFIKEFEFLEKDDTLIVAPEALSKFYFRDKIVSSWMTKEDRLNEINDYLNYLEEILKQVENHYDLSSAKSYLLGFSQGVHTATRWFINSSFHFHNLILCSSDFPKDAAFIKLREKLSKSKMYYIFGNKDRNYSLESFENNMKLLKEKDISFENIIFEGGHLINKESLKIFLDK